LVNNTYFFYLSDSTNIGYDDFDATLKTLII